MPHNLVLDSALVAVPGLVADVAVDERVLREHFAHQELLAQGEGIFCEPASAASVAGLLKLSRNGMHLSGKKVVCILTGTGLKDPDLAGTLDPVSMEEFPAELSAVERALNLVQLDKTKLANLARFTNG